MHAALPSATRTLSQSGYPGGKGGVQRILHSPVEDGRDLGSKQDTSKLL